MVIKDISAKALAIAGTVLVSSPVLLTFVTSAVAAISDRKFRMDYLMPAELFPFALIGTLLLLTGSVISHAYIKQIIILFAAAVIFFAAGLLIASVGGLQSGAAKPGGLIFISVIISFVLYSLSLIAMSITGMLVIRKLFA
jgi:hypothetical protein